MKLPLFQAYLKRQKIDAAIILHPDPTLTYFTQHQWSYGILVITPTKATLYVTALDARLRLKDASITSIPKNWSEQFSSFSFKKIGIHHTSLTVSSFEKLKKVWPKAEFVDVSSQLTELRIKKTNPEIQKIARACTITTQAHTAVLKELPKGTLQTEQDVALFLEKEIIRHGGEWAFPPIVAMGKNTAVPHHVTSLQPLKRGFLLLDFGARYQQYCADMTRVVFLGTPTTEERKQYQLLLDAQQAAIAAIKESTSFHQLEIVARKKLGAYTQNFTHSLGHGIGIEVHEAPVFSDKKQTVQDGLVFTVEPGMYFPGRFGLRIEDTLLFDGTVRILTKATKELMIVPFS